MQKTNKALLIFFLLFSCKNTKKVENKINTTDSNQISGLEKLSQPKWADSLVSYYIENTDDKIIKSGRRDSTSFVWLLDTVENSDSASYFVFQISHSYNNNLITDKWLYIDSSTRIIYEYDLTSSKLVKFSR